MGGNPPAGGIVDEVARPVPARIDRFENVWQIVEVLFGAIRTDRVSDVEVLGQAPAGVRIDGGEVSGDLFLRDVDILGERLCPQGTQRLERRRLERLEGRGVGYRGAGG